MHFGRNKSMKHYLDRLTSLLSVIDTSPFLIRIKFYRGRMNLGRDPRSRPRMKGREARKTSPVCAREKAGGSKAFLHVIVSAQWLRRIAGDPLYN